jgi:hypothetical protein
VAVCLYLAAMFVGLPQMPTVGFILVALLISAFVLGYKSTESGESPNRQKRD